MQKSILTAALLIFLSSIFAQEKPKLNKLTPEEEYVIIHKGTEMPYTGKYYKNKEAGTYLCRQCNAPLYRSEDKFDSGCGWPSFDDAIPGAVKEVKEVKDADGMRTEIVCANCGGHLGHVFTGEGFTEKNTRHCVNSASMHFKATEQKQAAAYFAGGCFWGVEHYLEQIKGVLSVESGYMGGDKKDPDYKQVCSGDTGHAEAVKVVYDKSLVSFEELAKTFFEIHDPTQVDKQGPDVGSQYRSAVFYNSEEERKTTEKLIGTLEKNGFKIATVVEKAGEFWPAEEYHQNYYKKTGKKPYCHRRVKRF